MSHGLPASIPLRARQILFVAIAAASVLSVLLFVDLSPRIDENFFFASDDPQVEEDRRIRELFIDRPQVIVSARGNIHSGSYSRRIGRLGADLIGVSGVRSVQDLHHGPPDLEAAFENELWRRLLVSEDAEATNVIITLNTRDFQSVIPAIERVVAQHREEGFELVISGVPYAVEMIRRDSMRDLRVFGIAVIAVFAIVMAVFFRSGWIVLGTMTAAGTAAALTLLLRPLFGLEPDVLTPNITSVVFVVTLSFIVYLTVDWQNAAREGEGEQAVARAIRWSGKASFLGMLTALLGFLSLILTPAQPVRNFGISCSIGAVLGLAATFAIYPSFLASADPRKSLLPALDRRMAAFFQRRHDVLVLLLVGGVVLALPGLWRLDTDPTLFEYFAEDTELRTGLERVDRTGGSSPLELVIQDAGGEVLEEDDVFDRMWQLQLALERDPDVGSVVSLPVLMQEAEDETPFLADIFVDDEDRLEELEKPEHGRVARSFVTGDRQLGRFFLRMKETGRETTRSDVVARLEGLVRRHGFVPVLTGGLYPLQGHLSDLVASSLLSGLVGLVLVFAVIALVAARSLGIAFAVTLTFVMIPLSLLGILGYLRTPQDLISVTAADVALGLAIDDMLHAVYHVRRRRRERKEARGWEDWVAARTELWRATVGGSLIVSIGFSLLFLSAFPPTRRLGLAVVLGTLISMTLVLVVFPRLAYAFDHIAKRR